MKCIRIGFGKIAQIHEEHLKKHGVQTIGVVEINPKLHGEIKNAGMKAFHSIEETIDYKPDFYDICIPASTRIDVLKALCDINQSANLLLEKPICNFKDIEVINHIFESHRGKIVVNENYASSNVTIALQDTLSSKKITPKRLIIESTKHRGPDFLEGRFLDYELGALGYEGSHLLAIVGEFDVGYEIDRLIDSDIDSIHLSTNNFKEFADSQSVHQERQSNKTLSHQGGAYLQFQAKNGCIVDLYTSMAGLIGFPCPPIASPGQTIAHTDTQTRYRILRVDGVDDKGVDHQIVGFYEPIMGLERSQAKLLIFKNWSLESQSEMFEDNTMSQHLLRAIRYFKGGGINPYSVKRAIDDVRKLHEWSQTCWHSMEDSDAYLGSKILSDARFEDAKRFKVNSIGNKQSDQSIVKS